MPTGIYESQSGLMEISSKIDVNLTRLPGGKVKIDWNIPDAKAYAGAVVVLSDRALNPSNTPTDGVRYVASDNLASPADRIGVPWPAPKSTPWWARV